MTTAVVTGLNGTIAPYVKDVLEQQGVSVVKFDRDLVDTNNPQAILAFLDSVKPDAIYHLANGPIDWQITLAEYAAQHACQFIFTSTESVFSDQHNGPYDIEKQPDAESDYGRYKIEVEQRIRQVKPDAYILRLGWQMGDTFEKNNILAFLDKTHNEQGKIEASSQWILATAYIRDTAEFIVRIPQQQAPGTYHLNGNPGISFFELVTMIKRKYGKEWTIVETEQPKRDGRILDPRIQMPPLTDALR